MNKVTPIKLKKPSWIPPPARTHHRNKIPAKATQPGNAATVAPCETTDNIQSMADDILDIASLSSISSSGKFPVDRSVHLCSIKEEMKLLTIHFRSLKRMSLFLNRYFTTHENENLTIQDLHGRIDDSVKEIIYEIEDLEYAVTLVENTFDHHGKTEEYLKMVKIKENLLSKVLDCYAKAVTIFESIIHKHSAEDITRVQQSQEILQRQLQISEKKCASQDAVIKDFERRLSLLQGKTNTVESYKSTLEDTRRELQKQLLLKEAQIKYLNTELSKQISSHYDSGNNEELLVLIEKIKKNASAEKTALKKALKLQKLRTGNAKESIEKLARDLKEKEKMMFSLASQRDQLKLQLTLAKNNSIDGKTERQEMKMRNVTLQEELEEKESSYKTQLKRIEDSLKEKTTQLAESAQDKLKLQKDMEDVKKNLEVTTNELIALKSNYSNIDVLLSQSHGDGNKGNAVDEVKQLITLLQDTKDHFKNIKTTSVYTSAIEDENILNGKNTESAHKSILMAVDEIKKYLLELKDICDGSNKINENTELETKLKELQQLYSECSKENFSLKGEIEELKSTRFPSMSPIDNYTSYTQETDFSTKKLQMELRMKTEEIWRIKQREKDLERQLEEVKDKLQRKEIENIRLFSVEEELKVRKNELSLLEHKREEESEKSRHRIGELQESLDKITTEHESLKHYVQVLKSSYLNVFGAS